MNFHEETAGARLRTWYTDREIRESRVILTMSKVKVPLWLVQATVPHESGLRLA